MSSPNCVFGFQRVIDFGAVRVVVPGNFPVGCFPIYLTQFRTNDSAAYDRFHCLRDLNNLSFHHNELLQQAIQELKNEHPNVAIIYGDYYTAFMWILGHVRTLGKFINTKIASHNKNNFFLELAKSLSIFFYSYIYTYICMYVHTRVCINIHIKFRLWENHNLLRYHKLLIIEQNLTIDRCKKLVAALEVIMTSILQKCVEGLAFQFVKILINASAGMEFIWHKRPISTWQCGSFATSFQSFGVDTLAVIYLY